MEYGKQVPLLIGEIHYIIAHPDLMVFLSSPPMDRLCWHAGKGMGMAIAIGRNPNAISITASRRR